jgi:protein-S-isoprenylcysteine O-methyltransferase Ste14
VGAEIRIRAEDRLLAAHFGDAYIAYRTNVRAPIPFYSMR